MLLLLIFAKRAAFKLMVQEEVRRRNGSKSQAFLLVRGVGTNVKCEKCLKHVGTMENGCGVQSLFVQKGNYVGHCNTPRSGRKSDKEFFVDNLFLIYRNSAPKIDFPNVNNYG